MIQCPGHELMFLCFAHTHRAQVKDNANLGRDLEVALIHLDWSWLILIDLDSSWLFSDFEQRNLLITRHSSFEGLLLLRASLGMTKASGGAQVKDNANLGRDLEVALIHLDWSWFVLTLFRLWTKKLIDYSTFVLWRFAATSSVLGHDKGFGRSAGKRQCQLGSWPRSCFDSSWLILIRLDSFQTLNKETYWLLDIRPLKVCCYFERPWAWQRLREERR